MRDSTFGPSRFLAQSILLGLLALSASAQPADSPPQAPAPESTEPQKAPAKRERFAYGFRLRTLPWQSLSVMEDRRVMDTTFAGRPQDLIADTGSKSPSVGGGAAFDFRAAARVRLTAELLFHRLRYHRTTQIFSGTDDPATGQDERSTLSIKEETKGRLWDAPVLVHYRGIRSSGILSHLWVAGGVAVRSISTIRSRTEITLADGSRSIDYTHGQPSRRNLIGAVVGCGFRIVDDFNIKVTPEIRYTRWSGATFATQTTRSPKGQLELSIGFTR